MKVIYFDLCAIPLYLMILIVCYSRRMTKGNANRLFLTINYLSLVSAVADLGMVILSRHLPFSESEIILETALANIYLAAHNVTNAVLMLFLLSLTRMTSLIAKRRDKILFSLPNIVILILLIQNAFTHTVFTVSAESGYVRGVLMPVVYAMAAIYGVSGLAYCVYSRRFLPKNKWAALLIMYLLVYGAVIIQFFYPKLLLEMFFGALGAMGVMLSVMRPEERMDSLAGMESWNAYQDDLRNILLSGERVQIAVIRMPNSREIGRYLGYHRYNTYISDIAEAIRCLPWKHSRRIELYFERPETIYLIADEKETGLEKLGERLMEDYVGSLGKYTKMGIRFEPQICLIRCPGDLQKAEDIISLGHKFYQLDTSGQDVFRAEEIIHSHDFAVEAHMEEILNRAIRENRIEMVYQPICQVATGAYRSAEALARLNDPEYGEIPPAIFIPAAETLGLILPIGDAVLEQVFRFVGEHDLDALGLQYIEINLSVAQCMQSSLPAKILGLQRKYDVDPKRINLEITETTFENISELMQENVSELIRMGYSFTLDDYGIGYSNIQRLNHLPLTLIKIDKSMLDEASAEGSGRVILEHTVHMMQSIDKKLVAEGAETRDIVDVLKQMDCDYIQGFYFSRPLPPDAFVRFLEEHNSALSRP